MATTNTLTLKLTSNQVGTNSTTVTIQSGGDVVLAKQAVMQIARSGGIFDDSGVWWPSTAISSIVIS